MDREKRYNPILFRAGSPRGGSVAVDTSRSRAPMPGAADERNLEVLTTGVAAARDRLAPWFLAPRSSYGVFSIHYSAFIIVIPDPGEQLQKLFVLFTVSGTRPTIFVVLSGYRYFLSDFVLETPEGSFPYAGIGRGLDRVCAALLHLNRGLGWAYRPPMDECRAAWLF